MVISKISNKEWTTIIIAGITSFFIFKLLNNLPSVINWILQNLTAIGIIALVVYMIKKK